MNGKVDKYFRLLYPEYDTLTPGEQLRLLGEHNFIEDYIDEIDKMYETCLLEAEVSGDKINKQEIIANIIEKLKTKQITTQKIGQATINTPTTAKKKAEQIEETENTKGNIKEGEDVGDDN